MTTIYNKLVRDKIPQIITEDGKTPYTRILEGSQLEQALIDKLSEETAEFQESREVEELADVLEVVYALAQIYNTSPQQLERLRATKAEQRGGFTLGIYLEKVDLK